VALGANQIWPTENLKSVQLLEYLALKLTLALIAYSIVAWFLARDELRDVGGVFKSLVRRQRGSSLPAS
jgi:hypothetical protein